MPFPGRGCPLRRALLQGEENELGGSFVAHVTGVGVPAPVGFGPDSSGPARWVKSG